MRVAGLQCHFTPDSRTNLERLDRMIRTAARRGARLICLPELIPHQYIPAVRDLTLRSLAEPLDGPTTAHMAALCRRLGVWLLSTLYEAGSHGATYNSAVLLDPTGQVAGHFRKLHVPSLSWSDEKAFFAPGDLGCPVVAVEGVRVGIIICYDRHFPELGRLAVLQGAHGLLIPTASRRMVGRSNAYQAELISRALENNVYVLGVNRWGDEGATAFFGRSVAVDPLGQIQAALGSGRGGILLADWDPQAAEQARRQFAQVSEMRIDIWREVLSLLESGRHRTVLEEGRVLA